MHKRGKFRLSAFGQNGREEVMKSAGYKGTLPGDDEDVAAGAEALDSETAIR